MTKINEMPEELLAVATKGQRESYDSGKLIIITSLVHPQQAAIYQKLIHQKLSYEEALQLLADADGDPELLDQLIKEALFSS
jgi:hypothetical protein